MRKVVDYLKTVMGLTSTPTTKDTYPARWNDPEYLRACLIVAAADVGLDEHFGEHNDNS